MMDWMINPAPRFVCLPSPASPRAKIVGKHKLNQSDTMSKAPFKEEYKHVKGHACRSADSTCDGTYYNQSGNEGRKHITCFNPFHAGGREEPTKCKDPLGSG